MVKYGLVWLIGILCLTGCTAPHVSSLTQDVAAAPSSTPHTEAPTPALPATLSYPMLIARAITANPDYAATLASARAEYYRYKARTDWRDPEVGGYYSERDSDTFEHERDLLGSTQSESGEGSRDEYGPGLSVYFSNPFENRYLLRAGRAAQREKEAGASILQNELSSVVYDLFIQAVYETKALSLLREREQLLLKWRDHLSERREANVATQADQLALELQLIRLRANLSQKTLAVQSAYRSLRVLANLPPDHPMVLESTVPNWKVTAEGLAENTRLFDVACANSPDLTATQAAYAKASAERKAARARQIPWFTSAQAGYSWLNNDSEAHRSDGQQTSSGSDSDKWELRLSMTVPVFAWMSSEIKAAEANMLAAQLKDTAIRQRIHHELTGYVADLRAVAEQKLDYQQQLDKLQPPSEENTPDIETFYKLSEAYRAAEEQSFTLDMHCAILYGQIMRTLSNWTLTSEQH